jgi:DsbC/DsbD-like thiol-disulfide interchange protein
MINLAIKMNVMRISSFVMVLLLSLVGKASFAQMTEDPTTWKYEVKKVGADQYQLIFHLSVKPGWHIWSMHPGGDGYEISPSFTFDKNSNLTLKGEAKEKGKATTTTMEGVDGKITYLSGNIDYTQLVTVKGKGKITGKHTYQICSEKLCLPPKDKDFVFEIK